MGRDSRELITIKESTDGDTAGVNKCTRKIVLSNAKGLNHTIMYKYSYKVRVNKHVYSDLEGV